MDARITQVEFVSASREEAARGLLGYVTLVYGDLRLDGLTLRRTQRGNLTISFPARRDRRGRDHPFVRPLDDAARRSVQAQVLDSLGLGAEAP